jgi:hypothetical protein
MTGGGSDAFDEERSAAIGCLAAKLLHRRVAAAESRCRKPLEGPQEAAGGSQEAASKLLSR